ncbi:class I adenylate-forming enzyme family protein [Pseudonocardia sp. GCM10023141]|uniref:class I adenylate-forming enzyme family protein n=1 Tax=Pseudonocardia sp. GCM10023141 TaxID=3252653 RepID=UPI003611627D
MRLKTHVADVTTLRDLVRVRAAEHGDREFAVVDDESVTFAQADSEANRLAHGLLARGVAKGDVVATYLYNSVDHILVWFACAKIGAIWAPLNIALRSHDLAHTVSDSRATAVVVDGELLPRYLEVRAGIEPRPRVEVLRGGGEPPPGFERLAALRAATAAEPPADVRWSDPAGLIYTGGTTGLPKGVLVANMWYFPGIFRYAEMLRPGPGDVHLGNGQMCHTIGSAVDVVAPLYWGMKTVLTRWFDANRVLERAREHGTTLSVVIGPAMVPMLALPELPDDADNPLRLAATGTGGAPRELVDGFSRRFGIDLLELYGQTETGPLGCVSQRLDDRPYHSLGTANGWADVAVLDTDDLPCPAGETGEIVLRPRFPRSFLLAYWGSPDRYVDACRELWFHTGDLGHLDERGYLHFDGRMAHLINRRGERISAFEVEQVVAAHPGVARCAVVGVPVGTDEEIKAYVEPVAGVALTEPDVVRFCAERIAHFKVPRYVEFVEEFPVSVTKGEIERHTLRARGVGDAWDREAVGVKVRRKV